MPTADLPSGEKIAYLFEGPPELDKNELIKAVEAIPGVSSARPVSHSSVIRVWYDENTIRPPALFKALEDAADALMPGQDNGAL